MINQGQNNEAGIKFEEDKWRQSPQSFADENPKMIQLVMKYSGGAVKDRRQAEYVLFGLSVLMIIISLFLFFGGRLSYQEKVIPLPPSLN